MDIKKETKKSQEKYSHMNSVAVDLFFIDLPKEKAIELLNFWLTFSK